MKKFIYNKNNNNKKTKIKIFYNKVFVFVNYTFKGKILNKN